MPVPAFGTTFGPAGTSRRKRLYSRNVLPMPRCWPKTLPSPVRLSTAAVISPVPANPGHSLVYDAATISLADLAVGDRAKVTQVNGSGAIRQRLIDMGLLPNQDFVVERVASAGGPVWIKLSGYQIALRNREAASVEVRKL